MTTFYGLRDEHWTHSMTGRSSPLPTQLKLDVWERVESRVGKDWEKMTTIVFSEALHDVLDYPQWNNQRTRQKFQFRYWKAVNSIRTGYGKAFGYLRVPARPREDISAVEKSIVRLQYQTERPDSYRVSVRQRNKDGTHSATTRTFPGGIVALDIARGYKKLTDEAIKAGRPFTEVSSEATNYEHLAEVGRGLRITGG